MVPSTANNADFQTWRKVPGTPVLELGTLSLAGVRHGDCIDGLATLGPPESYDDSCVWYPSLGMKFEHGRGMILYSFVWMRGARDWLYRKDGTDVYGPTMEAFSGEIRLLGEDCGAYFREEPEQLLATQRRRLFREYRREPGSVTFVLEGDPKERRLHLAYGANGQLERVVLY
jgi:hypothetical protein